MSRSDLEEALQVLTVGKLQFGVKYPANADLESLLNRTEKVELALRGVNQGNQPAIALLTSERCLIASRSPFLKAFGESNESIPFDKITGITGEKVFGSGMTISISRADNTDSLEFCHPEDGQKFVNALRGKIESQKTGSPVAHDAFDQIRKLKDLFDAGAITQDEFEQQKKKLLD